MEDEILYEIGRQQRGAAGIERFENELCVVLILKVDDYEAHVFAQRMDERVDPLLHICRAWCDPFPDRRAKIEIAADDGPVRKMR